MARLISRTKVKPPTITGSAASSSQINLVAVPPAGFSIGAYTFQRSSDDSAWTTLATQSSPAYSATGLSEYTLYYFRVIATDTQGALSTGSASCSVRTLANAPTAPNISATRTSATSASLSLSGSASAAGIASYSFTRSLSAAGPFTLLATQASPNYTDSTLSAGVTYYYRAIATDTQVPALSSLPSGVVSVVNLNSPPSWSSAPVPVFSLGTVSSYSLVGIAVDPDSDPITFSSIGVALPTGVTINNTTKALDYNGGGVASTTGGVRLRATATGGTADSSTFSVTIQSASAWADVFVAHSAVGPQLATASRIVGVDMTTGDYGARLSAGNGASLVYEPTGAFDGTAAVRLNPPTSLVGTGGNADYAGICNGTDIWNGGAINVAQCNVGFCYYVGARFVDLASSPKMTGFMMAPSLGASSSSRAAIFEGAYSTGRVMGVTANTVQSYHEPEQPGWWFNDSGPDSAKLALWTTTANHSASPPRIGQEWVYVEQEVDCRQNRGNPFGINRVKLWTRDGVVAGRYLDIPLNWDGGWSFASNAFIAFFEYLGGFWNNAGTFNSESYCKYSHVKFSANRSPNSHMGPPPGFLL